MQDKQKQILKEFFKDKEGEILTITDKQKIVKQLKNLGLTDKSQEKGFSFPTVSKLCKEYKICLFKKIKVGKKHLRQRPDLFLRENCVIIKLFPQEEEQS